MKTAIVYKKNNGGAKLVPIKEAIEDLKNIAKYFNSTPNECVKEFKNAGFNVFNPKWKRFVKECQSRK